MKFDLDIITKKILDKKVTVFCGAGVSLNSGVPLVKEIKSKILSALPLETSDYTFLLEYKMPFELFIESLIENSYSTAILDLFDIGSHNTNHLLIANLAKEGLIKNIITTNFDDFFESALREVNIEFELHYSESDFDKIDWKSEKVKIIKIHGSIHDKQNMAVTIKKVSNKDLVYKRNGVLVETIKHKNSNALLILGYSCSDIFDINPTISNCKEKNCVVYYFQHESANKNKFFLMPIQTKSEPNPFKDYSGFVIQGNTDKFIEAIWRSTLATKYRQIKVENEKWEDFIESWIKDSEKIKGEGILYFVAGQLLNTSTNHSKALKYFFKGLKISKSIRNYNLIVDFLFAIGRTYHGMQKQNDSLQESIRYLEMGLKESRSQKLKMKECSILLSLGIAYEDKHEHELAIRFYKDALKIAKNFNEQIIMAKCMGNLGIVYKNMAIEDEINKANLLRKALRFQKKSLAITINEGDKRSEGRTYGNIAVILSRQGKKTDAIEYSKKALQVAIDLSDLYHQGIWKHNIGDDLIGVDNIQSEKYLLEAKQIFASEGLDSFLKICSDTITKLKEFTKSK